MAENRPLGFLFTVLGVLGAAALLGVVMVRSRRAQEVSPSAADDVSESSPALLPPKPELVEAAESEDDSEPKDGDSGGDAGAGAGIDADDMRGFIAGLVRPWDPGEPVERVGLTAPVPELAMGLPEKRPAPGSVGDGEPDDVSSSAPFLPEAVVQDRLVLGRREDGGGADSAPEAEAAAEASVSGGLSGSGDEAPGSAEAAAATEAAGVAGTAAVAEAAEIAAAEGAGSEAFEVFPETGAVAEVVREAGGAPGSVPMEGEAIGEAPGGPGSPPGGVEAAAGGERAAVVTEAADVSAGAEGGSESAPAVVRVQGEAEAAVRTAQDPADDDFGARGPVESGGDERVTGDAAPAVRVLPDAEADTAVRVVDAAAEDAAASGATAADSAPGSPALVDPTAAESEMSESAQAGSEMSGAGAGGADAPGEAVSEAVSIEDDLEGPAVPEAVSITAVPESRAVPEDVPADPVPRGTGAGWRTRITGVSESGEPGGDAGSGETVAAAAAGGEPGGDGVTVETAAAAAAPVLSAEGLSTPAGAVPATAPALLAEGVSGPPGSGEAAPGADAESDEPLSAGDLVILSPAEGSFYSSEVTVRGEAPGFTELAWRSEALSTGGEIPLDGQAGFEFTAAAFGFNGELDITVRGRDAEGELRGSLIQLVNNGIGPSIELVSPLPGDYFTDYVEVTGRLAGGPGETSNIGEAQSLSWSVDGGEFRPAIFTPGGDFTFQVNMPRYDGTEDERPRSAELILLARDLNGNASERRIQLTDGRLTPGLVVTGPIDDSEYGAGLSLQGRVSDPYAGLEGEGGIQSVRYEILSPDSGTRAGVVTGEISIAADGSFDFPVFTGDLSGDQDISVIVTGNNGRRTIETLRLRQGISSIPDFTVRSGDSAVNVSWSVIPAASEYAVNVSDSAGGPVR